MQRTIKAALLTLAIAAGTVAIGTTAKADNVSVSIGGGGIAFGYSDGYWDRAHHWHAWRNRHEAEEWRQANADHYYAWKHNRDHDRGWHEHDRYWDHR